MKRKIVVVSLILSLILALCAPLCAFAEEHIGPAAVKREDGTYYYPEQTAAQPAQKVYEGPAAALTNPDGTVQGSAEAEAAAQAAAAQAAAEAAAQAAAAQAAAEAAAQAAALAAVHTNPYHHTCVEINLTTQTLYAFDGETLVLQGPCVTGTKGSRDTSVGDWKVNSKERDRYLRGTNADGSKYKSWVNFWMPFHGGQGMHDSSWRGTSHANYGGNIYTYDGSHGCVNLPYDVAAALYNFVYVGIPVHVHE